MEFEYSEEEMDYVRGVIDAILYYRRLHKMGFDFDPDLNYFIDTNGYYSQGSYEEHTYGDIMYSILSPMLGPDGSVDYSGTLIGEAVDFFREKNVLAEDHVKFREDSEEEQTLSGVYVHLNHPIITDYLRKHRGFEAIKSILEDMTEDNTGFFEDVIEDGPESFYHVDDDGIYFFFSMGAVYYSDHLQTMFTNLAIEICDIRKEEENEKS